MNYTEIAEFEWDTAKSEACLKSRGFDFAYILNAFFDPKAIIRPDKRWDYGEDRYSLIAKKSDRVFVVIYTLRNDAIRIISARKANLREIKLYENHTH